ncbi:hypothetical protein OAT89_00930 [bacterium]|nr:hypothetical protein [bacterium]
MKRKCILQQLSFIMAMMFFWQCQGQDTRVLSDVLDDAMLGVELNEGELQLWTPPEPFGMGDVSASQALFNFFEQLILEERSVQGVDGVKSIEGKEWSYVTNSLNLLNYFRKAKRKTRLKCSYEVEEHTTDDEMIQFIAYTLSFDDQKIANIQSAFGSLDNQLSFGTTAEISKRLRDFEDRFFNEFETFKAKTETKDRTKFEAIKDMGSTEFNSTASLILEISWFDEHSLRSLAQLFKEDGVEFNHVFQGSHWIWVK